MQLLVRLFDAPRTDDSWLSERTFDSWTSYGPVQGPHQLLSEYVTDGSDPTALRDHLTDAGYYNHAFDVGECYYDVTAIA